MFSYVIIAALVVVASADPVEDNSILRGSRIYGGQNTVIEKYPYQVSVQYGGRHICGGSIVGKHYVLTAGHCIVGSAAYYSIRAGTTSKEKGGTVYNVGRLILHENYGGSTKNDIALIRVTEEIVFDSTKQPVTLYSSGEKSHARENSVVTGWGYTEKGYPTILQTVTVPIVHQDLCNAAYYWKGGIPVGQICAGRFTTGGKDSCRGDSGGPLTINGRLAGIVSWGVGCAERYYPGVYTEVAYYRQWIDEHMKRSF